MPRPQVSLANSASNGQLTVTVTVAPPPGRTSNAIERLTFGAATNVRGQIHHGNTDVLIGDRSSQVTFTVSRAGSGAVTVPFVVVDDCPSGWQTFVGGGPNAF
jgi:hypothetical protein